MTNSVPLTLPVAIDIIIILSTVRMSSIVKIFRLFFKEIWRRLDYRSGSEIFKECGEVESAWTWSVLICVDDAETMRSNDVILHNGKHQGAMMSYYIMEHTINLKAL